MKKVFGVFIGILLFIGCTSLVTSCGKKTYKSEYFTYQLLKDEYGVKYATIIGLTEEGKKQETLVIPSKIDEYTVRSLGSQTEQKEGFESINLKKLYMTSTIKKIENSSFSFPASLEVLYSGNYYTPQRKNLELESIDQLLNDNSPMIYFAPKTLDNKPNKKEKDYKANVVYYLNNDGYNDVYFVDDVDGGKVNVIPPDPVRYYKNTYTRFWGWYKDKECDKPWYFDRDVIPEKEYDKDGNYIFKEISIYAKWEEWR